MADAAGLIHFLIAVGEIAREEFRRSTADLLVTTGRPVGTIVRAFIVSDLTSTGFEDIDFGCGKALYGGPAKSAPPMSILLPSTNIKGENEIVLSIVLPKSTMDRFAMKIEKMVPEPPNNNNNSSYLGVSSL
ncbi:hypothetical protein IFM89_010213 [Coptis chinensis]|uniref:Uncharacterized protein n=1 Tax=Coptis chinensis TaxID=261450 RepID=A0A835GX14_9MAGN|nr:hypothetical protein IFM89_010213 [Coptis chinensis]